MLIPITILVRRSAGDPPTERVIAVNPDTIAHVEESSEDGVIHWWVDGGQQPHATLGTVEEFAVYVNSFCLSDEEGDEEPCKPADSDTQ